MGFKREKKKKNRLGGPENVENGDKFQRLGLDWLDVDLNTHNLAKDHLHDLWKKMFEVMRDQSLLL